MGFFPHPRILVAVWDPQQRRRGGLEPGSNFCQRTWVGVFLPLGVAKWDPGPHPGQRTTCERSQGDSSGNFVRRKEGCVGTQGSMKRRAAECLGRGENKFEKVAANDIQLGNGGEVSYREIRSF